MPLETMDGEGDSSESEMGEDEIVATLNGIQSELREIRTEIDGLKGAHDGLQQRIDEIEDLADANQMTVRALGSGQISVVDEATSTSANEWREWLQQVTGEQTNIPDPTQ